VPSVDGQQSRQEAITGIYFDGRSLVLLAIAAICVAFLLFGSRRRNGRRFSGYYRARLPATTDIPDLSYVAAQLDVVMGAAFTKRRVLSPSEYRAFKVIEDEIAAARQGYRVFGQTSLGEVLASDNPEAFRAINSKRVDILIVDRGGWPLMAVEYQGEGHYQSKAAARDAIKKEALRRAGVRYVEVVQTDLDSQIRARVREHLGWPPVVTAAEPAADLRPRLHG
jgi:hypothetical protein